MIRFTTTEHKGVMVIAGNRLPSGFTICSARAKTLTPADLAKTRELDFYKYVFFDPFPPASRDSLGLLVFGDMAWCNHSNRPNAKVRFTYRANDDIAMVDLIAIQDIKQD